ncbi:MAG TPA: hypothetical protein VEV81_11920, partial [Pyrinomonadaceae bacterium]|nr:hypothetical protein [Pyrinomonadaceae bacterium]
MDDALNLDAPIRERPWKRLRRRARASAPTRVETGLALSSAALLVASFPDFNLWPLAWVSLAPLLVAVALRPQRGRAFLLGWMTGTLFFYGSCYWLSYAMVHYGHIPVWAAYLLVLIPTVVVGLFPGFCCAFLARAIARWGVRALFLAPLLWATLEWVRLGVTGQLWNAVGYSQAYMPSLIQTARWGGVYMVGFLVLTVNAAVAYALLERNARALKVAALALLAVAAVVLVAYLGAYADSPAAAS